MSGRDSAGERCPMSDAEQVEGWLTSLSRAADTIRLVVLDLNRARALVSQAPLASPEVEALRVERDDLAAQVKKAEAERDGARADRNALRSRLQAVCDLVSDSVLVPDPESDTREALAGVTLEMLERSPLRSGGRRP